MADNCSPYADCLQGYEEGVYYCACKPGFRGDGYDCRQDFDGGRPDSSGGARPLPYTPGGGGGGGPATSAVPEVPQVYTPAPPQGKQSHNFPFEMII